MKSYFEYTLKDPIKVASEGKDITASTLIVKGPRPKDTNHAMSLESIVMKSLMEMFKTLPKSEVKQKKVVPEKLSKKEESDQLEQISKGIIMGLSPENIQPVLFSMSELLCGGNLENPQATIDGVKVTNPLFDEISFVDKKAIIGRYAYHFLSLDSL